MTQLLFPAPPVSTVTVRGRAERIPIRRIFCVGRNYEAHAREMGVAVDREAPFYFTKAAEHYAVMSEIVPATVVGHPTEGRIELRVNGETKQLSITSPAQSLA